jgi:7,8-dihydropterin-6-yl-methyl-4-(beta-D-ribofuranosyl)aminobenzene 5'-phosphate synthase
LAISPSLEVGNAQILRFGMPAAGKSLLEKFGLAMHLQSKQGEERRNILLDFGFTSETFNNNIAMPGISLRSVDALLLCHGNCDHFGGSVGFLKQSRDKLRTGIPLYVGGEETVCTRECTVGKVEDFGYPDRNALLGVQVAIVFAPTPSVAADHAFTVGTNPTTSFEKVLRQRA